MREKEGFHWTQRGKKGKREEEEKDERRNCCFRLFCLLPLFLPSAMFTTGSKSCIISLSFLSYYVPLSVFLYLFLICATFEHIFSIYYSVRIPPSFSRFLPPSFHFHHTLLFFLFLFTSLSLYLLPSLNSFFNSITLCSLSAPSIPPSVPLAPERLLSDLTVASD